MSDFCDPWYDYKAEQHSICCRLTGFGSALLAAGASIATIYEVFFTQEDSGNNVGDNLNVNTFEPTPSPTLLPTVNPSNEPTPSPTLLPTVNPSNEPTSNPTLLPTVNPSNDPTPSPTLLPTVNPSNEPTVNPTLLPTVNPSDKPTLSPSLSPTINPSNDPTTNPTNAPTDFSIDMITIPAGSFTMGDSAGGGNSDELPTHTVSISSFMVGRYQVTYYDWITARTWGSVNGYTDLATGQPGSDILYSDDHPLTMVTWYDKVKWCNALSEMQELEPVYTISGNVYRAGDYDNVVMNINNNGYRLLTEAEWEYVARGGLEGECFAWNSNGCTDGVDINDDCSNVDSKTANHYGQYAGAKGSIGSKPVGNCSLANGYGLYDMVGNVWEWVWDWYGNPYYSNSPGSDPEGPSSGTYRVLRGCAWDDIATDCRISIRYAYIPSYSIDKSLGFRVCRRP